MRDKRHVGLLHLLSDFDCPRPNVTDHRYRVPVLVSINRRLCDGLFSPPAPVLIIIIGPDVSRSVVMPWRFLSRANGLYYSVRVYHGKNELMDLTVSQVKRRARLHVSLKHIGVFLRRSAAAHCNPADSPITI